MIELAAAVSAPDPVHHLVPGHDFRLVLQLQGARGRGVETSPVFTRRENSLTFPCE